MQSEECSMRQTKNSKRNEKTLQRFYRSAEKSTSFIYFCNTTATIWCSQKIRGHTVVIVYFSFSFFLCFIEQVCYRYICAQKLRYTLYLGWLGSFLFKVNNTWFNIRVFSLICSGRIGGERYGMGFHFSSHDFWRAFLMTWL